MYSTTSDMLKFGNAILTNKLLPAHETRKWLKPHVFTSSAGQFMGAPWEIQRSETLAPSGRLVEIYTKAGDLGLYHSMFALVPDYGLVVSVLTAGKEATDEFSFCANLVSQVLKLVVPALDAAARDSAKEKFAGRYEDAKSNSTVELTMDDKGGPGLILSKWVVRGFDVLTNYMAYGLPPKEEPMPSIARIYPSNLASGNLTAWRMAFDVANEEESEKFDAEAVFPRGSCVNWGTMDRQTYNYVGLEEFLFEVGDGGVAEKIIPRAFDVKLGRVE